MRLWLRQCSTYHYRCWFTGIHFRITARSYFMDATINCWKLLTAVSIKAERQGSDLYGWTNGELAGTNEWSSMYRKLSIIWARCGYGLWYAVCHVSPLSRKLCHRSRVYVHMHRNSKSCAQISIIFSVLVRYSSSRLTSHHPIRIRSITIDSSKFVTRMHIVKNISTLRLQ